MKRKFVSGGIILLYHRVAELKSDPQMLAVQPRHFAEHLEIVKNKCRPVALKDLIDGLEKKTLPQPPVAITFDDGYADNLANAQPLLERRGAPATIFVTAGYVGSGQEFWWDELERLILEPAVLPKQLELNNGNGAAFRWESDAGDVYDADDHRAWNIQFREDPTPRHALYRSLCELLRPVAEETRHDVLQRLRDWAGKGTAGRSTHLPLTGEEVARLDHVGLIEVGAHTCTHPLLSSLSKPKQQAEIRGSKTALETILGHAVVSFAYPFGGRADYNGESVEAVCQAGFVRACANYPGTVWSRSDCFQLPRLLVRDWDGETFERWLSDWVDD